MTRFGPPVVEVSSVWVEAVAEQWFPEGGWAELMPRERMPHRDHVRQILEAAAAIGWTPPVDKDVQ